MEFNSSFSDLLANLLGGVLLTFVFFVVKEKICPLPGIAGRWYYEIHTEVTAYRSYTGMVLRYVAMTWIEGHTIRGTVEKVYENSSTGRREFVGLNRTRGVIEGHIEKNYLSKDKIFIHVIERGHGRESTNFFSLIVQKNGVMTGSFHSMVADQTGTARWQRTSF